MEQPTAAVERPDFTQDASGNWQSRTFGDVYSSREGSAAQAAHVFLGGNRLPGRWRSDFTIGELGFGTGMNVLVAWEDFLNHAPKDARLHIVSVEKFPLTEAMLRAFYQAHPHPLAAKLLEHYPLLLPGLHRVHFERVTLTLAIGDIADMLPQIDARVDAWFLDGFAPAKNEAMWSEEVFAQIARLSAPDATAATYTVAGVVKRGLEAAGFVTEKVAGFGKKKEMLRAVRSTAKGAPVPPSFAAQTTPSLCGSPSATRGTTSVLVVGAGIAGATVARALAERGVQVTVRERGAVAQGASGNAAAVLYPQLTKTYQPATAWHFTGYGLALRWLQQMGLGHRVGMLKIGKDEADEAKLRAAMQQLQVDETIARWVERDEAQALSGAPVTRGGVWFAQGTWVEPASWCAALLTHAHITLEEQCAVTACDGFDQVVLANGIDAAALTEHALPMRGSAGQVTLLEGARPPASIVCHKGYAIPLGSGLLIGATYARGPDAGEVTEANHQQNINDLANAMPGLGGQVAGGRLSWRATTPDRLPYVGRLEDGLWVSAGHGSRGMISAPLAAEVIAAQMLGEPSAVGRDLLHAVDPRRRALK